eukprot:CAMPEP_0114537082 /NCGR_PEP_ID=MMETSP0109-20121206/29370_1 /TAXON_ID=29199 /ORGANISM="Chlorarachnion reptans, Strain CCCM449" /LENGTH=377 /DNA_ID=CAMNT_0001720911 /DNA_START=431 /DNA_END=1564 /DNA_ORIENTATION=-
MSFPEPNTMKVGRKQDDSVKAGKRRRMARVMRINANSSFEVQGAGSWLYESRLSTFSALIEAAGNSNLSKPGAFRKANSTKGAIGDKGPIELNQNNLQYEYSLPLYRLDIASLKEKYRKIFNTWTHSSDRYYLAAKIRAGLKHQSRGSKLTPGDSIWRLGNGTHDVRRGGRMFRTNDGRNLYIANRSGYKGVRVPRRQPRKGKMSYEAHLSYLNREIHLGKFATAEEAARAYDRANLKARGRYAFTNFPAEDYDLDRICGPETERERVENDLDQQLLFQMRCAEHLVRISMKLAGNNCGNLLPKHRLTRIVGAAKYRLGLSYLRNSQSVTISRGNGVFVLPHFPTLGKLHGNLLEKISIKEMERQTKGAAVTQRAPS